MNMSIICTFFLSLIGSTVLQSCPSCIAHLKRNDKPFFIRQLSTQIAATQAENIKIKKQSEPQKNAVHEAAHKTR